MSDTVITEVESSTVFAENLGIPKRLTTRGVRYAASDSVDKRIIAVACALELIKGAVAAGDSLDRQLALLGDHADKIQAALK
ncbi:hypothetical protein U1530_00550 [Aeromonas caviae]|uniref:hypothetical protein n=1 Tax=Aeromonas caviae TaxID=648 RepID=UPI003014BC0E